MCKLKLKTVAFLGIFCRPNGWCREKGSFSAADDLIITQEDLARFLISSAKAEGIQEDLVQQRNKVHSDKGNQASVLCKNVKSELCPSNQGYGLGWEVLNYQDYSVISHGGSDWSELARVYINTKSHDGVIVMMNAKNLNALQAMPEILELIDHDSPYINLYQRWYKTVSSNKEKSSQR